MANRVTVQDLTAELQLMSLAAQRAGVAEAANWRVDLGSKTYGRAYRLWLAKPGETGHYSPTVRDFLGMTANEALTTLRVLRNAFEAVTWATSAP